MLPPNAGLPTRTGRPGWRVWRWGLHWQILLGLLLGVGLGILSGMASVAAAPAHLAGPAAVKAARAALAGRWDYVAYDLVGGLFLNGLKLIIVPIVLSSLITAVAGLGKQAGFLRLGAKTIAWYLSTSLIAILIGLALVDLIQPGVVDPQRPILDRAATGAFAQQFADESAELAAKIGARTGSDFLDTIRQLVPPNFLAAAADNGQLLGLITVALLIGFFITRLAPPQQRVMRRFWQAVYDITLRITDLVLRFAPLGVAALIARTLSDSYARLALDNRLLDFVRVIAAFFVTVLAGLGIHFFLVLPLAVLLLGRLRPWRHFRAMAPALMTAFSTASSSATLPVTMECLEKRARVSGTVAGFVAPLGATVNMDGTALYECVAALFVAQCYGIELSFAQQFLVVWIALLTSIGVAGVPQASLVAIVIILNAVGVPLEGLALILVVDRFLDMCRTSVNVFSDACGAVVIARSEGETNVLAPTPAPA